MLMTTNRLIMGSKVNSLPMNILGWITVGAVFAATTALVITWFV
jgi:hypothetical protein